MSASILVLPGGAYSHLAPHEAAPVAAWLTDIGWDARVVEYPVRTRHPAPLDAVADALRDERTRSDVVGVIGFSAGGHLAGLAALALPASVRPDFAVLAYPVVSMETETHAESRQWLLGDDPTAGELESVSLDRLARPGVPPMFLWSTAEDTVVPIDQHLYRLGRALATAGVDHEVHVYSGAGDHGLAIGEGTPAGDAWRSACADWLERIAGASR